MKFSMHMPLNVIAPKGEFQSQEATVRIATSLERAGVTCGHVSDHPIPSADWLHNDPTGHDAVDPFTCLAFVAAATKKLMVMSSVLIVPYRNPFLTAKAAATLQTLSNGRFILGAGTGYQEIEFEALGVPFHERGAIMDEALETIRLTWAGGAVIKRGRRFNAAGNEARPIPSPPPPIWVGGASPKAIERAARWADGWTPFFTAATNVKLVRESSIDSVERLATTIKRIEQMRAQMQKTSPFDHCINFPYPVKTFNRTEAEQFCEKTDELAAAGVTWLRVKPPNPSMAGYLDYVTWFGEEVMPHYAES